MSIREVGCPAKPSEGSVGEKTKQPQKAPCSSNSCRNQPPEGALPSSLALPHPCTPGLVSGLTFRIPGLQIHRNANGGLLDWESLGLVGVLPLQLLAFTIPDKNTLFPFHNTSFLQFTILTCAVRLPRLGFSEVPSR